MDIASNCLKIASRCFEMRKICLHTTTFFGLSYSKLSRPPTSFGLFLQERKNTFPRERIVGGNVLKHAAVEWKHLPFSEKEDYAMRAQKAMAFYKESLNSLTDFERDQMKEEGAKKKLEKLKRRQKKIKITFGRPKQALNPYRCFLQRMFATGEVTMQGKRIGTVMREVSSKWNSLSFKEKEEYVELSVKDQERYLTAMEAYVRRLRQEGYEELIPKKYQHKWLPKPDQDTILQDIIKSDWANK